MSYAISTESATPTLKTFSPAKGKVGASVSIWGYNLLNTTAVSFNGVPAKFTVESTLIKAVVPAGATSGVIEVTTPNGSAQAKNRSPSKTNRNLEPDSSRGDFGGWATWVGAPISNVQIYQP